MSPGGRRCTVKLMATGRPTAISSRTAREGRSTVWAREMEEVHEPGH